MIALTKSRRRMAFPKAQLRDLSLQLQQDLRPVEWSSEVVCAQNAWAAMSEMGQNQTWTH
jgi:hypothetical protein